MRYPLRWTPSLKEQYARYWEDRTLWSFFEENAARRPEKIAIVDGSNVVTYRQLASSVDSLTCSLIDLGTQAGDSVAFQLPNWWEAMVLHLALVRLSAVSVPIATIYRERELSLILKDADVKAIVIPCGWKNCDYAAMIDRVSAPGLRAVITCRGQVGSSLPFEDMLAERGRVPPIPRADPNSLSLILYTSGTTAEPKGVEHTQNTLMFECRSIAELDQLTPEDVIFMASPITHAGGVLNALELPLRVGAKTVLMDNWNGAEAIRIIEKERVTWTMGATPFLQDIVQCESRPFHDISSLRLFVCGGASMTPALIRSAAEAGIPVSRAYGSSEHPTVSGFEKDPPAKAAQLDGRVHDHVQIKVEVPADPRRPALPGEVGEICTKGPDLFIGYHQSKFNEEAFDEDGWFHTGDLGRVDDENYVQIVGRIKDIIIRKGQKFSAKELEDLLGEHPAVKECAVIGLPDDERGERVCSVVVLHPGWTLTLDDVRAFLTKAAIARQKFPEQLELVSALPKTPSGKVRKFELRDSLSSGSEAARRDR
jgi:cyclohexanecarboxylate-CoA ligase